MSVEQQRIDFIYSNLQLDTDMNAVEVGVDKGDHAEALANILSLNKLYLVDPWARSSIYRRANGDKIYTEVVQRFQEWRGVMVLRMLSVQAATVFRQQKEGFDFVYLDGAHDRVSVQNDIDNWWPLVREGGILCGHDYKDCGRMYRVKYVVDKIFGDKVKVWPGEGGFDTWWVTKE